MTRTRRDNNDTQFGNWLRTKKIIKSGLGYDAENIDYVWFAFYDGWFILIEEKRHGASQRLAQADTHGIIHQLLENVPLGTKVKTMRGNREIEYRGYYLVQFQKTNPDDSLWIKINGTKYTKNELLYLLKFGELLTIDVSKSLQVLAMELDKLIGEISFLIK